MKQHNISIETKYFEPIREGQITLLIFDKKVISPEKGDYIEAKRGEYSVQAVVDEAYVKSFFEITDKEAQDAGFLNKDFLKDELIRRFNINSLDCLLNSINNYLFFLVKIHNEEIKYGTLKKSLLEKDLEKEYANLFKEESDVYETTSELYDMWWY